MPLYQRHDQHAPDWESASHGMAGFVGWALFAILLVAGLVQIYAGLELLGLRWDGAPFLRDMVSVGTFNLYERPRLTTQIILEAPTVLALRFGIRDPQTISVIWSLTLQLAPLLVTCASYVVLPRRYKIFFVMPVFSYFAGASNVATAGLIEGPTATACFWVIFYFLLFAPARWPAHLAMALAAVSTLALHEIMAVLAPVLALGAYWRARQAASRSRSRLFYYGLVIFFLIVMAVHIGHVFMPRSVANRDGFLHQLFGFQWIYTSAKQVNVPAVLGLLACSSILAMGLFATYARWAVALFGVATIVLLFTAQRNGIAEQFYARNHPALLSFPLSIIVLAALRWPRDSLRLLSVHVTHATVILVFLAAGTLTTQFRGTMAWSAYVSLFRNALASRTGLVPWETLMQELPSHDAGILTAMNFPFANPDMSLMLAPKGHVQSIVMNPRTTRWGGWRPIDIAEWPKGWNYDAMPRPPAGSGASGAPPT